MSELDTRSLLLLMFELTKAFMYPRKLGHQFRDFMESQNHWFDDMTAMFRQYLSAAATGPPPASKRSADDAYGQESVDAGDHMQLTTREEEVRTPKRVNDRSTPSKQSSVVEEMQSLSLSQASYMPTNLLSDFQTPERQGPRLSNSVAVDSFISSSGNGSKTQSMEAASPSANPDQSS
jgi:hypothetical protein